MKRRSIKLQLLGLGLVMGGLGCAGEADLPAPHAKSDRARPALTEAPIVTSTVVHGVVTDQTTGELLSSTNVVIQPVDLEDETRGSLTMADGRFEFPDVPSGRRYRLSTRTIGYVDVDSLVDVAAGLDSLRVNLRLRTPSSNVTFDEFVIEGSSIMVEVKDATTSYTISSEDLTDYAVDKVEEAVRRQAGIASRSGRVRSMQARSAAPPLAAGADPVTSAAPSQDWRDLVTGNTDELWVIQKATPQGPEQLYEGPGTGCLIAIRKDETEVPVPLEHTDVRASITGYMASVEVSQRFHNPFDETIEAEYIFPLPHDAAVNDFLMIVGERRIRGIIREKEEARAIYEDARRSGYVASLLQQERPNIFRQKVANIEPAKSIEVELHYFNALPYVDGSFEFAFPLVVGPRFNPPGSKDPIVAVAHESHESQNASTNSTTVSYLKPEERSGHDVNITVDLDAGVSIEDLQSANHVVVVENLSRRQARVELSSFDRIANKDFVLRYRVAGSTVKSEILVHRDGDQGYFSMLLVPPADLKHLERAPVEFVFVVDCSGSMSGWPMQQAKEAMRRSLRQLRPSDSFQVIRFSERASALGAGPLDATAANIERGLRYVDDLQGGGGTMMIEGIKSALDFRSDPNRMRIVSFMTDGYIGNENEIFAAIAERLGSTRIFSFGVGKAVNRHLLEGMARIGRGAVAYIGLGDDLNAIDNFYARVRHPALTDIEIDWGEMVPVEVFPRRLPDLFVGRPVLVLGRFEGSGQTTVKVRGRAGRSSVDLRIDVDLDDKQRRNALPSMWARAQIGHISDRLALRADADLQTAGLELALDFNLMSQWTSFVAVDASDIVDLPGDRQVPVPVPVPEGVRYDTTVGGND